MKSTISLLVLATVSIAQARIAMQFPLFVLTAASIAQAHMMMEFPIPMASKFDTTYTGTDIDYNYSGNLSPDGSNFPCRGNHLKPGAGVVATFKTGQSYDFKIAANPAHHQGGSCQLSLSYDNGKTFRVFKSMIGKCTTKDGLGAQTVWKFVIPNSAPPGQAVFSWTWFNKLGAREMYQNCAYVKIENDKAEGKWEESAPLIFVANIFGSACRTLDGSDVIFPNPGDTASVEYGLPELKGKPPTVLTGCPADSGSGNGGSSAVEGVAKEGAEVVAPLKADTPTEPASTAAPPTSTATPPPASTAVVKPTAPISSCNSDGSTNGKIICDATGDKWSICDQGKPKEMGLVAAGMACKNGAMVRKE